MLGSVRATAIFTCLLLLSPTGPAMAKNASAQREIAVAAAMAEVASASRSQSARAVPRRLFDGELAETHPSRFGPLPEADRIVMIDEVQAVARVPAHGEWPDLYFFLDRGADGSWRATALRALALPPFIRMIHDALRPQESEGDEAFMLANVELAMRPDRALREWFFNHRARLDNIIVLAQASEPGTSAERPLSAPGVVAQLRALHLLGGSVHPDGTLRIVIGGVQDDSVGMLHVPDRRAPPPMSRHDLIWIEPLAGGWFLYRTT
jgi:hypothetical protein